MQKTILKLTTVFLLSVFATTSTVLAQRLRLLADIELVGEGLVNQTITTGNYTNTESITGMSAINLGLHVGLPLRFEASVTAGSLIRIEANSTYTSAGNSSSSMSFAVPKMGLEMARSFIWNEDKFVSGLNFAFGIERYWPQTFSASGSGGKLEVKYNSAFGHYYRIKVVFREGRRMQFEPNVTFRHFDLVASEFSKTGSSNEVDPSMMKLQIRNISVGVNILFGFSNKNKE